MKYPIKITSKGMSVVTEKRIWGVKIASRLIQNITLAGPGTNFAPKKGAIYTIGKSLAKLKKNIDKKEIGDKSLIEKSRFA
jgi:hypothetical protein